MRKFLTYLDNESYLFWRIEVTGSSFITSWGKIGTVGETKIKIADSEKESLKIAAELINEKKSEGYVVTAEGYIAKYDLPVVLKTALSKKRIVESSDGTFVLSAFTDIKVISVLIDHHFVDRKDSAIALAGNPYRERKGLFCTTAYLLVHKLPELNPAGDLLVWLPLLELFGIWDREHRQLYLFENTTWVDIEKKLPYYLSSRSHKDRFSNILSCEKFLNNFDFIPEDLPLTVKDILAHPTEIKLTEAAEFINQYEQRLLRHPWCAELDETYEALVTLYHRLGQAHERDAEYSQAIKWLKRSLLVVNQAHHFRSKVFIDIFIQLSFCYFETSRFDESLRYMKMYQVYDATAWDTCEQIITSISRVQKLYEAAIATGQKAIKKRSAECYAEAIRITHDAVRIAPNDPLLHFNLACFYSLSYKTPEALYHLEEAIKKGYKNHVKITSDQDLEYIRSTPEFEDIRQRYF